MIAKYLCVLFQAVGFRLCSNCEDSKVYPQYPSITLIDRLRA